MALLSQDEARFPMVPTLRTTLGVKGHRPVVGTWDNKAQVYVFGSVNTVSGRLTTNLISIPTRIKHKTGKSKVRHLQETFVKHIKSVGRHYSQTDYDRVVLVIDNAPWHRGEVVKQALEANPHVELYRLPSYSPELNPIERWWKLLRHRATHNRLFLTTKLLRRSLRASISYYQTVRKRITSMLGNVWEFPESELDPAAS